MCGIFGVIAATRCYNVHEKFLIDAMQTGQVRGVHGSGMFTVTPTGYVRNKALAVPGTAFLMDERASDVLNSSRDAKIVVGHNRYTTSGQNIDEHCHPFRYEHLVGVHNGGVSSHVLNKIEDSGDHDVDSARIFSALNAADNPLDVLTQIHQGAYCLVWYDGRKRSMFMARNHARPMHVAETSTGLYFASELGMLSWLLGRHSTGVATKVPIARLDPHTLYEISLDDGCPVKATPYEVAHVHPTGGTYIPPAARLQGSINVHPYYTGQGIYGGSPAAAAFKRYYSEQAIIRDFPSTAKQIDIVESLQSDNSALPEIPFLLLGLGKDVLGEECAYGLISTPDGLKQHDSLLASCRIRSEREKDMLAAMLADGAAEGPKQKDWCYPVIPMQYRAALLRPTGELILSGELPRNFNADELDECTWVYDMEPRTPAWVREFVGPECLVNLKPEQLISAWTDLKNGKTQVMADDDIPF